MEKYEIKCEKCKTVMEKIGSWQIQEAYEDYDAEYTTLYQCPECKRVLLT